MPSLTMDLVRRVERLPKPKRTSEALQPLFEAISNAIHSTQNKFGDQVADKGRITVDVDIGRRRAPVSIVVSDNGTGFDQQNYDAFVTTDTDNKIAIGGKGVGRLLWLDCFEKIHVESDYREGRSAFRRSIDFRLSPNNQIQNLRKTKAPSPPPPTGVAITFEGIRDNGYRARFPGRAANVFQHLTSHFLPTFIGKKSPEIAVHCGDETRVYPDAIDELIKARKDVDDILTDAYGNLTLTMMECDKVVSSDLKGSHFVHFIAHDRTVWSQKIDGKLGLKYFGEDDDRVFHACLFGDYLNQNVNQERTSFTFEDSIIESIVNDVCMPYIEDFLAGPLNLIRTTQNELISSLPTIPLSRSRVRKNCRSTYPRGS